MRILCPHDSLEDVRNGLFLAGLATRTKQTLGWREEFIRIIDEAGYDGDILNPENPEYGTMDGGAYERQTRWEWGAMRLASAIVFWIPRTAENLGLITNIEFGEWMHSPSVYAGWPEGSINNCYLESRLGSMGRQRYSDMETMIRDIMLEQSRPRQVWFTSDTHFGSGRTLRLSCRPFRDVDEMDYTLISNWNKRVGRRDIVFHLGDVGDLERLRQLNGRICIVRGNHDDPGELAMARELVEPKGKVVLLEPGAEISLMGRRYRLFHKPVGDYDVEESDFCLFGHIHRTQLVKRNGINVGCDCYGYAPVSLSDIEFLRDGVEHHFDENVFTDKVINLKSN